MPKPNESKYFTTGKSFGKFKTTDMNGNKINTQDLKGKTIVMNFWFINCPPCRTEIPHLNKLVDKYKMQRKLKELHPTWGRRVSENICNCTVTAL